MPIRVRDFTMNYEDNGSGMPVLFIHGFPLSHALWQPQLDGLLDVARVIAPDLRGFGGSDPMRGVYTMEELARDCVVLLDELGLKDPIVIGGLSMGGYVIFALYRLFPERVSALILAATCPGADSPEAKVNREKTAETVLELGVDPVVKNMLPKMLAPANYQNNPDLVRYVREMMESCSVEGVIGASLGMKERPDSTPLLAQINCPTLILHGTEDQLMPASEAEKMNSGIPHSQLRLLPEAGHLLNLEKPDLFNQAIRNFLLSL